MPTAKNRFQILILHTKIDKLSKKRSFFLDVIKVNNYQISQNNLHHISPIPQSKRKDSDDDRGKIVHNWHSHKPPLLLEYVIKTQILIKVLFATLKDNKDKQEQRQTKVRQQSLFGNYLL